MVEPGFKPQQPGAESQRLGLLLTESELQHAGRPNPTSTHRMILRGSEAHLGALPTCTPWEPLLPAPYLAWSALPK